MFRSLSASKYVAECFTQGPGSGRALSSFLLPVSRRLSTIEASSGSLGIRGEEDGEASKRCRAGSAQFFVATPGFCVPVLMLLMITAYIIHFHAKAKQNVIAELKYWLELERLDTRALLRSRAITT